MAAAQARHPATATEASATTATAIPTIVVGATKGAASKLATTATSETDPCNGTTIGAQTAWAASGTATTGPIHARRRGNRREITVPHTTYLLDDGDRPEMAELAERLGARHLTRPDHAHAKAGNVNHALEVTSGDLVLVLDADHVPLPTILESTVGYFDDPLLALVQTPHDFSNRDSVQHTQPQRNEQSLFYRVVAPCCFRSRKTDKSGTTHRSSCTCARNRTSSSMRSTRWSRSGARRAARAVWPGGRAAPGR